MKKLVSRLLSLAILTTATTLTSAVVSCNNKHVVTASDISYVSQDYDYVYGLSNTVTLTFVYLGHRHITKIDTVNIENSTGEFKVINEKQQWVLDEHNQFKISVALRKSLTESHITTLSFIFTYTDSNYDEYYEILHNDNMQIHCDYQDISLTTNDVIVNTKPDDELECVYQINANSFPEKIDSISVQQESYERDFIEVVNYQDVPVDPHTHRFTIKYKLTGEPSKNCVDIYFTPVFRYKIDGQSVYTTSEVNRFVTCTKPLVVSHDYGERTTIFTTRSMPIYFNFSTDVGVPTQIDSLRIEMVDRPPSLYGEVKLKHDTNVHANSKGDFLTEIQYEPGELDAPLLLINIQIYASFKIGNLIFNDICLENPYSIKIVNEPQYKGTKVFAFALESGYLTIPCLTPRGDVVDHPRNLWYSINGGEPQQYDWNSNRLDYGELSQIELWCDDGEWSTNDFYYALNFTGQVCLQGDITALLDGKGGEITSLDNFGKYSYVFYRMFASYKINETEFIPNIVTVSPNFLATKIVCPNSYSYLFDGNANLLYAPNIDFVGISNSEIYYQRFFANCTNLIQGPDKLNDDTGIHNSHFDHMFENCQNLIVAPVIYKSKFLGSSEDWSVFNNCFSNCNQLRTIILENYVDDLGKNGFESWVLNVAEYGELYYKGADRTFGPHNIPEGWDVINIW